MWNAQGRHFWHCPRPTDRPPPSPYVCDSFSSVRCTIPPPPPRFSRLHFYFPFFLGLLPRCPANEETKDPGDGRGVHGRGKEKENFGRHACIRKTLVNQLSVRGGVGARGGSRPLSISFPLRRNPHFSSFFPRFRASHKFQQPSLRAIQDSIFPTLGSSGGGIMSFPPPPPSPAFATSTTLFRKVCQELLLPLAPPHPMPPYG